MLKGKRRTVFRVEALEDRLPPGDLLALALPDFGAAHTADQIRLLTEEPMEISIAGADQQDEARDEKWWSLFPEEPPRQSQDRPAAQSVDDEPSLPSVNSDFGDFGEAWLSVARTPSRAIAPAASTLDNGGSHWGAATPALEASSGGTYASVLLLAIHWNNTVTALTGAVSASSGSTGASEAGLVITPRHPTGVQAPESFSEEGDPDSWWPRNVYDVGLTSQPSANVEVFITSPDNQVCPSESWLFFDASWWQGSEEIVVRGCRDFRNEPFIHTGTLRHTTVSEDPAYNGLVYDRTVTLYDTDADTSWEGPELAEHPMAFMGEGGWYYESYPQRMEELRIVAPDPRGESDPYRAQQSITDPDWDYDGFFRLNRHPDDPDGDCYEAENCSEVYFLARRPGVYGVQVAFRGGETRTFFINVASPPADAGQGQGQTEKFVAAVHPTAANTTLILIENPPPEYRDATHDTDLAIMRSRRLASYTMLVASIPAAIQTVRDYYRGSPLHVWIYGHGSADAQHVGAGNRLCNRAGENRCLRQNPLHEASAFGELLRGKIDTLSLMGCHISSGIDRPDNYLHLLSMLLSNATVTAKVRGYTECVYSIAPDRGHAGWVGVPRGARLRVSTNGRPD
ncbi:MAG: hypothetical protein G01um101438_188 [Parcubacteria group bacterium Gr01-1014_38]|nr:MAG: hypothetical protein G01um101438_188 [Parcubacteria group bacterium Gr01-1014_38]